MPACYKLSAKEKAHVWFIVATITMCLGAVIYVISSNIVLRTV